MGLSALLAACEKGSGTGPPLPPCTASGAALSLLVGEYRSVDPGPSSGCRVFPAATSAREYLLVPQAASGTPNDSQSFRLSGAVAAAAMAPRAGAPEAARAELSPAGRFHVFLRQSERARAYPGALRPEPAATAGPASRTPSGPLTPDSVGTKRTFKVCGDLECKTLPNVTATLLALGQHIAIYVDDAAPQPGLSQADLDELRTVFDTRLYEVDTLAFGRESDIDANGVVIVLMTNRVNELVTEAQCNSTGFVAGYFNGADIDPFWRGGYNNGEVFYSIVADPLRALRSCAHAVAQVKRIVPVTFVHEFQHMISFNQHVLLRSGAGEILWLNEALSHYAEELGGRSFLPADTSSYCAYVAGNLYDAAQYFQAPQDYFVVDTAGIGGLANRGAYWLLVRYLIDQFSADTSLAQRDTFTRKLVLTNLTGPQNVTARTGGVAFETLLARWALANWVSDLPGFSAPSELQYKMWRFRTDYGTLKTACAGVINTNLLPATLPLTPAVGAGDAVDLSGVLRAGSGTYVRAQQGGGGSGFTLRFSDGVGSALRASLVPRLNVIRIQ